MAGLRIRAGENLAQVWASVRQRATLAGDPGRIRSGETRPLQALVAMRGSQIQIPQMVAIPGMPGKTITVADITVGLFSQVMPGYEPIGHNAAELARVLRSADATPPLNWVNLADDGRGFAKAYSSFSHNPRFRSVNDGLRLVEDK